MIKKNKDLAKSFLKSYGALKGAIDDFKLKINSSITGEELQKVIINFATAVNKDLEKKADTEDIKIAFKELIGNISNQINLTKKDSEKLISSVSEVYLSQYEDLKKEIAKIEKLIKSFPKPQKPKEQDLSFITDFKQKLTALEDTQKQLINIVDIVNESKKEAFSEKDFKDDILKTVNEILKKNNKKVTITGGGSIPALEWGNITGNISEQADLQTALNAKQDTLVSGTNIKTINGESVLGSGNILISGDGNGIYSGNGVVPDGTKASLSGTFDLFYGNGAIPETSTIGGGLFFRNQDDFVVPRLFAKNETKFSQLYIGGTVIEFNTSDLSDNSSVGFTQDSSGIDCTAAAYDKDLNLTTAYFTVRADGGVDIGNTGPLGELGTLKVTYKSWQIGFDNWLIRKDEASNDLTVFTATGSYGMTYYYDNSDQIYSNDASIPDMRSIKKYFSSLPVYTGTTSADANSNAISGGVIVGGLYAWEDALGAKHVMIAV